MVRVISRPASIFTGLPSLSIPVRISGPFVSSRMAHSSCVFFIASRRLSSVSWWYSYEPWLKLNRATHSPARSSSSSTGTSREVGPSVQTIFVLATASGVSARIAFTSNFIFPL